jgi:hypothetical protein
VGGIDLNKLTMRRVAEAVLALSASPASLTASGLARHVRSISGQSETEYGSRRAAYDIKKLRAKGMVRKSQNRAAASLFQKVCELTALLVLREQIIRPLLAASGQPEPPSKPVNPTPVDNHYETSVPVGKVSSRAWPSRPNIIDNLFFIFWDKQL